MAGVITHSKGAEAPSHKELCSLRINSINLKTRHHYLSVMLVSPKICPIQALKFLKVLNKSK